MRNWLPLLMFALPVLAKDSCLECHQALEGTSQAPAVKFAKDIHSHFNFGCADCHGGDPKTDDMEQSMSPARGFLGKIPRTAVPKLCARCHSDASLIHKFKPQQRVDQLAQYLTSIHGKRLAAGDTAVANCVDCHSIHDIREVKDPLSPVHPLKLPETCARCHADKGHMAKYKIGVNQFAEYRTSVHWEALSKRGDLSAPSCASCHGNHGATPPQVASVAAICGTCHVMFEDLYNKSPHQPVFAGMGQGGCAVCHDNHGIRKPTIEMLAGDQAMCAQCHDAASAGGKAAAEMAARLNQLDAALRRSDEILTRAEQSGMEVSEAQLRQQEARQELVKARVNVHAFQVNAVAAPVENGLKIAVETFHAGQAALKERNFRRLGLSFSLIAIGITIGALWRLLRAIESKTPVTPPESA